MTAAVRTYRWQCIECKSCSLCGTSENDVSACPPPPGHAPAALPAWGLKPSREPLSVNSSHVCALLLVAHVL